MNVKAQYVSKTFTLSYNHTERQVSTVSEASDLYNGSGPIWSIK